MVLSTPRFSEVGDIVAYRLSVDKTEAWLKAKVRACVSCGLNHICKECDSLHLIVQ